MTGVLEGKEQIGGTASLLAILVLVRIDQLDLVSITEGLYTYTHIQVSTHIQPTSTPLAFTINYLYRSLVLPELFVVEPGAIRAGVLHTQILHLQLL